MWIRLTILLFLVSLSACSRRPSEGETASAPSPPAVGAPPAEANAPPAASVPPNSTEAPSIQEEAWTAIRGGALLVDVRSRQEFDQGHLEGATLIPHDQIAARASELGEDKSRPIVLYCRSGNRSSQAKRALEALGFTSVMNAGGYESLKRAE